MTAEHAAKGGTGLVVRECPRVGRGGMEAWGRLQWRDGEGGHDGGNDSDSGNSGDNSSGGGALT